MDSRDDEDDDEDEDSEDELPEGSRCPPYWVYTDYYQRGGPHLPYLHTLYPYLTASAKFEADLARGVADLLS